METKGKFLDQLEQSRTLTVKRIPFGTLMKRCSRLKAWNSKKKSTSTTSDRKRNVPKFHLRGGTPAKIQTDPITSTLLQEIISARGKMSIRRKVNNWSRQQVKQTISEGKTRKPEIVPPTQPLNTRRTINECSKINGSRNMNAVDEWTLRIKRKRRKKNQKKKPQQNTKKQTRVIILVWLLIKRRSLPYSLFIYN